MVALDRVGGPPAEQLYLVFAHLRIGCVRWRPAAEAVASVQGRTTKRACVVTWPDGSD